MLALPSAKFIHCYRDPWDNAISLFKQNYSTNIFYASSFFGIATEFANYEFLMQQWKNMDGKSAFFDVEYEQLVKDEDSVVKALWEYCSLKGKYSPKERKKHFAYTASMQQITKDIYTSSVEKSDFTAQKNSFLEDLEKQIIDLQQSNDNLLLVFDAEIMETWDGLPNSNDLPSSFYVDYVRVWRNK